MASGRLTSGDHRAYSRARGVGHIVRSGAMSDRGGDGTTRAGLTGLALVVWASGLVAAFGDGPAQGKAPAAQKASAKSKESDERGEGDPDLHQGRGPDPPGEVPELPPTPPGGAVPPRDLRAGAEAVQGHRLGDRGSVDAAVEADPGRGAEAQARPVTRRRPSSPYSPHGPTGAPRSAIPSTCRLRPSSPRVGSSARPT